VLEETVLRLTGRVSPMVVTPPKAGLDFAAVKVGDQFMVVSADPITGVSERIGAYAMNVSANDVATSGRRPQFAETVVLLPEGSGREEVGGVARQLDEEARALGISIVGGHTEVTPGLVKPIVVVTAFAFVESYVTSGDARAGDTIMMTKTAGLEGTAALASHGGLFRRGIAPRTLARARGLTSELSVVDEAVAAFETGDVRAMHDCTEGGVLGAAFEMSLASGVGFRLKEERVPVARETREVCRELGLDPLKLIGSGSLLVAVKKGREKSVQEALKGIADINPVGEFVEGRRTLLTKDGREKNLRDAPEDELWRALARLP
jgi:hydrogenase expression/formation protein HypE